MANKPSESQNRDYEVVIQHSKLINMGFDESISMVAAQKYPKNLNQAIDFISTSNIKHNTPNNDSEYHDDKKTDPTSTNIVDNGTNTDTNDKEIKLQSICGGISKCKALMRLIESLQFHEMHKNNERNNIEKISEYFGVNKHQIINDYHHILNYHLNEDNISKSEVDTQFKLIYEKMMDKNNNLCCDIEKCMVYTRNNRQRENDETRDNKFNDSNISKYVDLLDCIHCYFLHSVDVGYRIITQFKHDDTKNENKNDNDENICYDKQLFTLKSYLQTKRKHLEEIRGNDRMQHSKFSTQFTTISTEEKKDVNDIIDINDSDDENDENAERSDYSFGLRYRYWNHGGFGDYDFNFAKCKYSSLKEELVMNKIHCLEINVFVSAFEKAQDLINTSEIIKSIKCKDEESNSHYGLERGISLHINHVLAVVLYTDYDTLSYKFSSTFRKTENNETNDDVLSRNQEYGNWCKYLVETVNCFGTRMDKSNINVFYHGASLMYFDKFIATFNSPTSTTSKLQIATIFAKNDGIILELTQNKDEYSHLCKLRYFNCSFISCYGNEDERLFIQPLLPIHYYLKFDGIRNMKTNENYGYFINVLAQFEKLLNWRDDKKKSKILKLNCSYNNPVIKVSEKYVQTMNELMDLSLGITANINKKQYPSYILNSFRKWTDNIREIRIDRKVLKKHAEGFKIWDLNKIGDTTDDNLIEFVKLNKVFKQITKISCWEIGRINIFYMQSLLTILNLVNELSYSKLKEISLSWADVMLSSSELTEYQKLFQQNGWEIRSYQPYDDGVVKALHLYKRKRTN